MRFMQWWTLSGEAKRHNVCQEHYGALLSSEIAYKNMFIIIMYKNARATVSIRMRFCENSEEASCEETCIMIYSFYRAFVETFAIYKSVKVNSLKHDQRDEIFKLEYDGNAIP